MTLKDLFLLKWIVKAMFSILKLVFHVLKFTGAWISVLVVFLGTIVGFYISAFVIFESNDFKTAEEVQAYTASFPDAPIVVSGTPPFDWAFSISLVVAAIPLVIVTVRNLVRFFTDTPDWTYRKAWKNRRKKISSE